MQMSTSDNAADPTSGFRFPADSLPEVFSARARQFPARFAATDGERSITYAQLERASSRLAAELVRKGVGRGALVGLYMERSIDMIACLLGILKAGGAYLPIDPTYPETRIRYILKDSGVKLVLGTGSSVQAIGAHGIDTLAVDQLVAPDNLTRAEEPIAVRCTPQDLAYVIYTSGSTGNPKGVMIEHANVLRLFEETHAWFGFDENDVWSMFHSIGFDFSVWEIWGALLFGGKVVVVPYDVSRSPAQFHQLVAQTGVTVLNQTPSAFRNFDQADRASGAPLALRHIVFGGEALTLAMLKPWLARHGDAQPALINMYGITETTVHVSYKRLSRADIEDAQGSAIGVAIPDLHMHLLDTQLQPVPNGVPGELYIEGPGVARGYLNQPQLTAERFVTLPLGEAGQPVRVYKTGDIALRTTAGDFMFAGRADDQLKIRGFRIEPKEIEACLQRDPAVAACHVDSHDYGDGDVRLVAYVVPHTPLADWNDAAIDQLMQRASQDLPDYMRPSAYVLLPALPLTPHGKIDRRALPSPETNAWSRQTHADRPLSDIERHVLQVWSELGLSGIGLTDDFFDAGGTSLSLIRSLALLKTHYKTRLDPSMLAQGATVETLARIIGSSLSQAV
ncbi:amino acid adenylation domain-containing protein [Paraburkholderia jirisanensis]